MHHKIKTLQKKNVCEMNKHKEENIIEKKKQFNGSITFFFTKMFRRNKTFQLVLKTFALFPPDIYNKDLQHHLYLFFSNHLLSHDKLKNK